MAGKTEYKNNWQKENVDRVNLTMAKGRKDAVRTAAAAVGESVNAYINTAITLRMDQDSGGTPPTSPQEPAGQPAGAGGISLPPDALKAAREAAEAAGEALESFVARAVATQAQRDKASLRMGINPATGDKLNQIGGADRE